MCECTSSGTTGGSVHEVDVSSTTGETITGTHPVPVLEVVDTLVSARAVLSSTIQQPVGRQMNLQIKTRGASGARWTICSAAVGSYDIDASRGAYQPLTDAQKQANAIMFAFWQAGTHTVTVTATVGGHPQTTTLTFSVAAPEVRRFQVTMSDTQIVTAAAYPGGSRDRSDWPPGRSTTDPWLAAFNPSGPAPGCAMAATVHAGADQEGDVALLQLIRISRKRWAIGESLDGDPRTLRTSGTSHVLDNAHGTFYRAAASADDPQAGSSEHIAAGATVTLDDPVRYSDSPGMQLDRGARQVTTNDEFQLFLVYKPAGMGIWVPLRWIYWAWGGTASHLANGLWNLTGPSRGRSLAAQTPTFLPTWTRGFTDVMGV